jgi:hypothetical protein
MKKILLYIALTIIFITGIGLYFKNSNLNLKVTQEKTKVEKEVKTSIDFGDGTVVTYSEKDFQDKNAYDLLKKTVEVNKIKMAVKQYDFGVMIEEIDGRKNTNEKAWIYFIDALSASNAADKYIVQEGDLIEWKFIKPEF